MTENTDHRQSWFGLIATFICIVLIFALLTPAVWDSDWRSQRNKCQSRMKDIARAAISFEGTRGCYPTYQSEFGGKSGGPVKLGSWVVSLMPYLEHQALRDTWDDPSEQGNWVKAVVQQDATQFQRFYPKLATLTCPQDKTLKGKYAPLSYVANTGFYLLPSDPAIGLEAYKNAADDSARSIVSQRVQNGLFANGLPMLVVDPKSSNPTATFGPALKKHTADDVRDGTSQTIALFENSNNLTWHEYSITDDSARYRLGCVWLYVGDSTGGRPQGMEIESVMRINFEKDVVSSSPKRARPNAHHQGIVIAAMADGSTKAIAEEIDYHVYQALMTPHTRQSDAPNVLYLLKEDDFSL